VVSDVERERERERERECLGLELMVKLRTLLPFFTLVLKAEARDYSKVLQDRFGKH